MDKLILSFEGTVLKSVAVGNDKITIGRKPENDIQVDNLAVSSQHAAVTREGNDIVLEDLNSTNGTIVNGQMITRHILKNFDVIELGKHKIKFVSEVTPAQMEKTMVMRRPVIPSAPGAAPAAPPPPPAAAPAAAAQPAPAAAATVPEGALQVLTGPAAGKTLDLTKNLTKVGSAGVQVSVITRRPNGYYITHVEGTGFPLVNGSPIGPHAVQLHDQDTIEIAGTKMSFFYKT